MEEIEVNIKLEENKRIYNIPIRKSDTVLKLKEYCKIISNIPQNKQNLLYKGKILLDEKLIEDYNIENNHDIILVKKEDLKSANASISQNSNNSNPNENFFNINNINFSINKEINPNDIANAYNQVPDFLSIVNNMDLNLLDKAYQFYGMGKFSDVWGVEPQEFKILLKDPSTRNLFNNMMKDPSLIEMSLNNPLTKAKIQNNPYFNLFLHNPNQGLSPQIIKMAQECFREKEKNSIGSSNAEISVPPGPFESLNNNQINQ